MSGHGRRLKDLALPAARGWGVATSPWRPLPDFLLLGAKRGGTTSLYYALLSHPQVLPQFPAKGPLVPKRENTKGVHFLDAAPARSTAWYRSHFPSRARRALVRPQPAVTGESTPYYLHHPRAAERAAHVLPDVRLIVLLRDPVQRTWSHYREQVRNGVETLSFEEALDAEPVRTAGEEARLRRDPSARSTAHEHQAYAAQSEYGRMLRPWLERYPRQRLLVLLSEEFYADPQGTVDLVAAFLGLPPAPVDAPVRNAAPELPLTPATRARLRERFAPTVEEVAGLLGRPTGWEGT